MIEIEINTAIVQRARAGESLSEAELLELDSADVLSLGMLADDVRRARVGDTVTYTRVLDIGPTGLPSAEHLAVSLREGGEVRLMAPGPSLSATITQVAEVRAAVGPDAVLTGYSLAELTARDWAPLLEVLTSLKQAGLDGIAEAPVDLVTSPQVAAVTAAGLRLGTLSVQHGPAEGRVPLLLAVRTLLAQHPQVTSFAPLPREQPVTAPTTGYHDVRMVALARIALPGVPRIEADWQQYGPKLAQVALTFGSNHLDRVSPTDDPALGRRRSNVEEVRRNITAAGFRPVEQGAVR